MKHNYAVFGPTREIQETDRNGKNQTWLKKRKKGCVQSFIFYGLPQNKLRYEGLLLIASYTYYLYLFTFIPKSFFFIMKC